MGAGGGAGSANYRGRRLATGAKIFQGDLRRANLEQRRVVAGTDDHDAALEPLFTERVFDELEHFAAALADQRDDRDIGAGVLGNRRHQRALAHAGA